jgi:uncharacterized protein YegP (UPF0339 family)
MGEFILKENEKRGEFSFKLNALNGQTILSSEGYYTTKSSCENGIASVRKNSQIREMFEEKETASGEYYFILKAQNGQVMGKSGNYLSSAARMNGISSVMKNAPDAILKQL